MTTTLRMVPLGGRPPKVARDMAVMLAVRWFKCRAQGRRVKAQQEVVDLWVQRGFVGITDPAHVRTRVKNIDRLLRDEFPGLVLIYRMGEDTTANRVGPGACVFAMAGDSCRETPEGWEFKGRMVRWEFGDERAMEFEGEGTLEFVGEGTLER